jgi:cell division protein FtsW
MVSMGGTSLLFTCISMGIILSVSRFVEQAEEKKKELTEIELANASNN